MHHGSELGCYSTRIDAVCSELRLYLKRLGNVLFLVGLLSIVTSYSVAERYEPGIYQCETGMTQKGYDPKQAVIDLDGAQLNAFNFNFTVQFGLPIGLGYPQNAGVGLDINLTYNSVAWRKEGHACDKRQFYRIRRENPVGLGFDLSLGRIIQRHVIKYLVVSGHTEDLYEWAYISPDGNAHVFRNTTGTNEYLTVDGTRLKAIKDGDLGWILYFPSGEVHEFRHFVGGNPTSPEKLDDYAYPASCHYDDEAPSPKLYFIPDSDLNPANLLNARDRDWVGWHVTRVYSQVDSTPDDPLTTDIDESASYTIEYQDFNPSSDPNAQPPFEYIPQTITDQHGRKIHFAIETDDNQLDYGMVKTIDVPAPPGTAGEPRRIVYEFEYEQRFISIGSAQHPVMVLQEFRKPTGDGSSDRYMHEFTYTDPDTISTCAFDWRYKQIPYLGNQIETVKYPSGHVAKFTYKCRKYLSSWGDEEECMLKRHENPGYGVYKKEIFKNGVLDDTSQDNYQLWEFTQNHHLVEFVDLSGNCEIGGPPLVGYAKYDQLHTMIDPQGSKTVMQFRTPPHWVSSESAEYGNLVNEKYHEGDSLLVKEVIKHYTEGEYDWGTSDKDQIIDRVETYFHDDAPNGSVTYMIEEREQFDRFNNPQRVTISGNSVGELEKIIVTDYASDNRVSSDPEAEYCASAQTLQSNWLGGVVARSEVYESDGQTDTLRSRVEYGYDTNTGQITKEVQRLDLSGMVDPCASTPTATTGDIVKTMSYTDKGDLYKQKIKQEGSSGHEYEWDHDYEGGVLKSKKNTSLGFYDFIREIDVPSGKVRKEVIGATSISDPLGVVTTLDYDLLGRTIEVQTGDDQPQVFSYEH